jgi:glycosyltransferase involved in cell wall biosynthesis
VSNRAKTVVVMPAYNAERTLEKVCQDIPWDHVDEAILVDDCSGDGTVEIAQRLALTVVRHPSNRGYGANQKTCYRTALEHGADYVVMLHPDHQYDARMIGPAVEILRLGNCDVILGNRIRTRAPQGPSQVAPPSRPRPPPAVEALAEGAGSVEAHRPCG